MREAIQQWVDELTYFRGLKTMLEQGQLSDNFFRFEFRCRCGCNLDFVDAELIWVLQDLRDKLGGRPITINSGCRCPMHNAMIGGKPDSQHLLGKAADIVVSEIPAVMVQECLLDVYPGRYGIGRYETFTHIDVRAGMARWED